MFSLSSLLKSRNCLLHLPTILVDSESKRKFNKLRLDALSIPHCVIKKGRCHGARHGKTEEQKEYHVAWNAWKRCCKKVHSQGGPLFEPAKLLITTLTPSIEIPAQEHLLQKYKERVERLSQRDRLIKICTDAGFLKTVEVGQYFMTKHTDEFSQFTEPVTGREYTLPRDEKSTEPKGWIRGNTKIGPVLEVTTSYLQGNYEVEIRIESVNKDNSHSWGQNFSWIEQVGHRLDRQRVRRQRAGDL